MWQFDVPHKLVIAIKHGYVATGDSTKPQKTAILENRPIAAFNTTVPHNAKNDDFRVVWHESDDTSQPARVIQHELALLNSLSQSAIYSLNAKSRK